MSFSGSRVERHNHSTVFLIPSVFLGLFAKTVREGGAVAQLRNAPPLIVRVNALLRLLRGFPQTSFHTGSGQNELAA